MGLSAPLDCDSLKNRTGTILVIAGSLVPPRAGPNNVPRINDGPLKEMSPPGKKPSAGVAMVELETPEFKSFAQVGG